MHFKHLLLISVISWSLLSFASTVEAKTSTDIKANIEGKAKQYLINHVKQTKAPSLSVAAAHNGKLLFAIAEGYADKSKKLKATTSTQYRTGSVSKVIGTTAFMPLIEQGKVKLSDKIVSYLPYLPKHYKNIEIKHLLTHTSGIRHYRFGEYGTNIEYPTLEDATKVFRDSTLEFQPGTSYRYTTYGINLIIGVIEKTSKMPFKNYMDKQLFKPLKMINTELEIKGNDISNYAIGYRSLMKSMPVKEINVSNKYIGGGMRTTPTDLVNMVLAIQDNKIFNEQTKALMLSVPFPKTAPDRALGWRYLERKGQLGFLHTGGINGFESFLMHFLKDDITIAVMVNQDDYDYTGSTLYSLFDLVKTHIKH